MTVLLADDVDQTTAPSIEAMFADLSGERKIPVLLDLVTSMSSAKDPAQLIDSFIHAMRTAYGKRFLVMVSTRGLPEEQFRLLRILDDDNRELIGGHGMFFDADRFPAQSGGLIGEIIRTPQPKLASHLNLQFDPVLGNSLAEMHSMIAVPVFDEGQVTGWVLIFDRSPQTFSPHSLEDAILRVTLLFGTAKSLSITNELRKASNWIQSQVDLIAKIQRSLLPRRLPRIEGLTMAVSYQTYDRAGGDYYNLACLRRTAQGRPDPKAPWALVIADATGHGPAAAVMMAMFHAVFESMEDRELGPSEMLEFIHRHLFARPLEGQFVTAFIGLYDPQTRILRYAAAGHPPPLIKSASAEHATVRLDKSGGLPIGAHDRVGATDVEITLLSGQTLVLYTDGITDSTSPDRRVFGIEGIERAVAVCAGSPDCVINAVLAELKEFEAGARPEDDQTILALQVD